ncbi:MAG TPA: DNA alkylation repair protein [Flavisolibacter sp.]|nr:DNA alkylation repair protein [Flavisolibacter sp.]
MPEPLKNIYNPTFFELFTKTVKQVLPTFKKQPFLNQIFDTEWEAKELKQRMRHIATVLKEHLPGSYRDQVSCIIRILQQSEANGMKAGFEHMFFPDFIEQYGLEDLRTSLEAMETVTQFTSCEFAIRPFLLEYPDEVMAQMLQWSRHPHPHVRRFSSEGCRPRLPWAMAIPALKKDPSHILPILENLKEDESLFVRKSVANNLNDISKDHPDIVVQVVKSWKGVSKETDWIIRHGCRTLLRKAHSSTYELFGLDGAAACQLSNFKLSNTKVKIGGRLGFSFALKTGNMPARLRIEYAVYYAKARGKQSRKIFQIRENVFQPENNYVFNKEQRFQDFTTRKHHPGKHKLAVVVNGRELAAEEFFLHK